MQLPAQLPAHLRQFVVAQNYAGYTAEDQAVWRFVVLQTHARLLQTAHPAYAAGFAAVGISTAEIPRIERMNQRLADTGFQAICVDGFIPPRAFQSFQARGFLPIAADIRTSRHLTYTPAPDIIHEAAGHAPFLAHAEYARYLRAIGLYGEKAFASPYDREVYDAIHSLSELKEDPQATAAQIQAAEARLSALTQSAAAPSEIALLSRLYWWTVEYGLVGKVDDYRLYGAGLLSSIGEGHFCHEREVRKLPLGAACIQVPYDITRPQPQLFVARDFEQLHEVLEQVCDGFAFRIGGRYALEQAQLSAEAATLDLDADVQLTGTVSKLHLDGEDLAAISLQGDCAVAMDGSVVAELPRLAGYVLPLGHLQDGTSLSAITRDRLRALAGGSSKIQLQTRHGISIEGTLVSQTERAGRVALLLLEQCTMSRGSELLYRAHAGDRPYPLLLAERVVTAHAALPAGYHPATELPDAKTSMVPRPRLFAPEHERLIQLYDQALSALREGFGSNVVSSFERIHEALQANYPDEWLLRWNLLESLAKLGKSAALSLTADLTRELEQLELRYANREPIATGLAYVRSLYRTEEP
jgi:phenylalanine-4-hydroxylase